MLKSSLLRESGEADCGQYREAAGVIAPQKPELRLALQIAIQLPDDKREALRTLEYIRELVDWHDESAGKPVLG